MDAAIQSKINELVTAAMAAGAEPDEVMPILSRTYMEAMIARETAKACPVPNMPLADIGKILAFLTDGGGVPDMQEIYSMLRKAINDRDQPAFWRYLFMLCKSIRKQYPHMG